MSSSSHPNPDACFTEYAIYIPFTLYRRESAISSVSGGDIARFSLFSLVAEYRKLSKLLSTYINGYLKHLNPVTCRIHPDLFVLSTDTGRMNCRNPNCQNMPRKTNDPIGVRGFIKAPESRLILSLDYSQIELRVGAFYCRDAIMMDTYRKGGDIHAATTSVIFGCSYEEAQDKHRPDYKEERTIAKNVNFGTFYGLYARGLQRTLKFKAGVEKTLTECQNPLVKVATRLWWHGSVGRTNCSKCPTGLVGRRYEIVVAWLSR